MSEPTEDPPPLSSKIEDFVRAERERTDPPAEIADGVFSRLRVTLNLPVGPVPTPTTSPPTGDPAPAGSGDLFGGLTKARLLSRSSLRTVATLLLGAAAGAGIHEGLDRRAERGRAVVSLPPPTATAPLPVTPTSAVPPLPPPARPAGGITNPVENRFSSPPTKVERGPQPELPRRDRDLAAERTLIEQARTALSREMGEAALAVLEHHGRDFPHGALEEERESLLVQVLVSLGHAEQALKVGARFHRKFPRSIFGAVVDDALASIP